MQREVREEARGRWWTILSILGVSEEFLRDRHGPCPLCGGTDRFRWDNKDGRGTYLCSQCGAGDGLSLLMKLHGWSFNKAASEVRKVAGAAAPDRKRATRTTQQKLIAQEQLLADTVPIAQHDPVDAYLAARGLGRKIYPASLRLCPKVRFAGSLFFPAMVALVRDPEGNLAALHQTFLSGGIKAPVDNPRRFTSAIPTGSAIRLSEVTAGVLGVAEGIETALAAEARFGVPVWAALNTAGMLKWSPPQGVRRIIIFADNDHNFAGQAAAYQLAQRLKLKGLDVAVEMPPVPGEDWADLSRAPQAATSEGDLR